MVDHEASRARAWTVFGVSLSPPSGSLCFSLCVLRVFVVYMSERAEMPALEDLSLPQVRRGRDVLKRELEDLRRRFDMNMVAGANREALRPCGSAVVFSSEAHLRRLLRDAEAELEQLRPLHAASLLAEQAALSVPPAPSGEIDE